MRRWRSSYPRLRLAATCSTAAGLRTPHRDVSHVVLVEPDRGPREKGAGQPIDRFRGLPTSGGIVQLSCIDSPRRAVHVLRIRYPEVPIRVPRGRERWVRSGLNADGDRVEARTSVPLREFSDGVAVARGKILADGVLNLAGPARTRFSVLQVETLVPREAANVGGDRVRTDQGERRAVSSENAEVRGAILARRAQDFRRPCVRIRSELDPQVVVRSHRHVRRGAPRVRGGESPIRNLAGRRTPDEKPLAPGGLPREVEVPRQELVDPAVVG